MARLFRGFLRKSIERRLTHRKLYLASKFSSEFNNFKDQNDLVEQFYRLNGIYDWENSNWNSRFVTGQKNPPELK